MASHVPDPRIEDLIGRLERAATELRFDDLAPERAAVLVDECARLAAEAGAELDGLLRSRDAGGAPGPSQLALDS
jgi:hypothetical protein